MKCARGTIVMVDLDRLLWRSRGGAPCVVVNDPLGDTTEASVEHCQPGDPCPLDQPLAASFVASLLAAFSSSHRKYPPAHGPR